MMNVNFLNFRCNTELKTRAVNFGARREIKTDSFEKTPVIKTFELKVYNPYTDSYFNDVITLNFDKQQTIKLQKFDIKTSQNRLLTLDYNPKRIGYLWDKMKNKFIKTNILISNKNNETTYHFMSTDLKKEYGYVEISNCFDVKEYEYKQLVNPKLLANYPKMGIVGPRIIVEYLQNWNSDRIGGIGKLADRIEVQHCIKNNIEPNIVSEADFGSHIAHYLRGKRFFPLKKGSNDYNFFIENYGTANVNKVIEKLLKNAEDGEKTDVSSWGLLPMYMPKERAKKIAQSEI